MKVGLTDLAFIDYTRNQSTDYEKSNADHYREYFASICFL
jgi:hypothetical protein